MIFFKTISNETIIRFNFCDIRNNQGLGKCYHLRPTISVKHVFNLFVSRHSFLHHTWQVRLVRSGMGSCIFRGVSIDVSTDISIDSRSTYRSLCRSRVDRVSAKCRSRVGRISLESLSSIHRYVGNTWLQSIGQYSVDNWSIVGRYFADVSCAFTGESFLRRIPQALISTAISTSMKSLLSEMLMCLK